MTRVKRGKTKQKRHKRLLKQAKGFLTKRRISYKTAKEALYRAGKYAYRDRRAKKRLRRQLWTIRINAALRERGFTYGKFINALKKTNIEIDRKILAELALNNPSVFDKIVTVVKK